MTFWEHLDELRKVLFHSLWAIMIFMVAIFVCKDFVFDRIILAPLDSDFVLYRAFNALLGIFGIPSLEDFKVELVNIDLAAQFFIHVKISFFLGLVVAAPYIFYELWGFLRPALYPNEKTAVKSAFGFAAVLFYCGVLVGYFLIFPLTLRFLGTYQVSDTVANQIALQSYISMFVGLIFIMGIVFEMPMLAALLSRLGIINKQLLQKYRKHAVIVLLILAAVITPSGDAFTLFAVGLPLYGLYEVSIAVCKSASAEELADMKEAEEEEKSEGESAK